MSKKCTCLQSKILLRAFVVYISSQEWIDDNLRWNESEYGDIKDLRIPPAYIWAPDILMYNR